MIVDPNRIFDGYSNLVSGVDDGRRPNLLDKNQCETALNTIFRGGSPNTRPPFKQLTLSFENPGLTYDANGSFVSADGGGFQSVGAFFDGLFQEASYFAPSDGKEYIMASIAGRYYQITPGVTTASVREIQLARRNQQSIPIAYHLQAGKYHISQDAQSAPIIFDGTLARRASTTEVFTGKMMGYGLGRIVLIGTDNQIYFGDIRDGKGNGDTDLLGFTETTFLNEGFPSALPSGMGSPTAVQFIPQQDTATGVGACLVFGQHGVAGFDLSLDRTTWKDSAFQTVALMGIGAPGHRCTTSVNEDIWFRSNDGYRSYRQARAQVNQYAQIPMSTNISKWMNADTQSLLSYGSVITFDKRIIGTVTPYQNQGSLYHNGLVSLDFDILSTFGRLAQPSWDGAWTERTANPAAGLGLKIQQVIVGIFNGTERAFAFFEAGGQNHLMEILANPTGDDTIVDNVGPITAKLFTRSMDFDSEFNEKSLYGGDLWIDKVEEPTTVTVTYRPDQYPVYQPWYSFDVSPINLKQGTAPISANGFSPRRKLPKPPETADALATKRAFRRGFEFQAGIQWEGRAAIRKFRAHAITEVEQATATP